MTQEIACRTRAYLDAAEVLEEVEAALDPQIYTERERWDRELPDDHEYHVTITEGLWRRISTALNAVDRTKTRRGNMTDVEERILANQMAIISLLTSLIKPESNPSGAERDVLKCGLDALIETARLLALDKHE